MSPFARDGSRHNRELPFRLANGLTSAQIRSPLESRIDLQRQQRTDMFIDNTKQNKKKKKNKKRETASRRQRPLLRKTTGDTRLIVLRAVVARRSPPHLHVATRSSRDLICDVSASHIANCFYVSISQRPPSTIEIALYARIANYRTTPCSA